MKPSVIAVLDVGKTNKKLSIYNRRFQILDEARITFDPVIFQEWETEPVNKLLIWMKAALKKFSIRFHIRAISITTHGAACATLDAEGQLTHPVVSYTCPRGANIQYLFYKTFGLPESLQRSTCSADIGFANIAKILFQLKTLRPQAWAKTTRALFYPQYIGYEICGGMAMEPTYMGCHTYLWNYDENEWSHVAKQIGVDQLFPEKMNRAWDCLGRVKPNWAQECGLPADCLVTVGIHDSNASLLPYLAKNLANYILNSTGSWCVGMKPSTAHDFANDEIGTKTFYNLDALGRPVKTSIFCGGMEYEQFSRFTYQKNLDSLESLQDVVKSNDLFIIPGVLPGGCAFPTTRPRVISKGQTRDLEELKKTGEKPFSTLSQQYFAALNLSLAFQTRSMLMRCGLTRDTTVFIEGGFSHNKAYCSALATLCPECTIRTSTLKEATSLGAAMLGWMLAEGVELHQLGHDIPIPSEPVPPLAMPDLDKYEKAFHEHLA